MKAPLGICVVLPNDDPHISSQPCWTDPNIRMVCLRSTWANRNPAQGQYDFSYFETGMQLARANGKKVQMQVNGSLSDCPAWVYGLGAKSFPLTNSKGTSTPCPWDAIVQAQWTNFVANWAAKYDNDPLVVSITMWAGGKAIECFFCDNSTDQAALDALGGPSLWLSGAQELIKAFDNWPNTAGFLAVGDTYPDSNATMTSLAQWLWQWWSANPGYLQSNALSATFPSQSTFPHTNLDALSLSPVGFQLNQPCKAMGQTLASVLANALKYRASWVQIYPGDPTSDPTAESAIANFNNAVGA